ncbi:M12 family metallopeptidase, partial [Chitinimonas sp. BJB300]
MKLKFSILTLLVVTALGVMAEPNVVDNSEQNASRKSQLATGKMQNTGESITYRNADGKALLDDIVIGDHKDIQHNGIKPFVVSDWSKQNAIQSKQIAADNHSARATRWPNNTVYYSYEAQLSQKARDAIQAGMKLISDKTAVRFVQRTNEPNYVRFFRDRGEGCYSNFGMIGGMQEISIDGDYCEQPGVVAHEIMHALGWQHEHMRPDRDAYIQVHDENIKVDHLDQYIKRRSDEVDSVGGYDYDSIMHYASKANSKNGLPTIVPLRSDIDPVRLGQRKDLSPSDVASIQHFYPGDAGQVTLNATFSAQLLTIDENGSGNLTLDLAGADLAGVRFYPDSDNTRVIAYNGIDIQAGQSNQRTVRVTPVRGAVGTANVKVRVIAANGKEATASFKLTVLKDKNGGGAGNGGTGTISKYDRSGKYKQGDIVDVNGKRYTLTVRVNNQPGGDYW